MIGEGEIVGGLTWRNWAGTEHCEPEAIISAESVDHVSEVVADAAKRGVTVRPVGSAHSYAPLVPTDGIILDISALSGIVSIDEASARVRVRGGTPIRALGEPLWEAGLTLSNQGSIDTQTIAGAISTSTHGAGIGLKMMSASVVAAEVVTASGELETFGPDDPRLPALRASMGTLGVIVSLDLQLEPIFKLRESLEHWPLAEVLDRWEEETRAHRHFSFIHGTMYEMEGEFPPIPDGMVAPTLVRTYDVVDLDAEDVGRRGARVGRPYRIYPDVFTGTWEEIEPFVPFDTVLDTVARCLPIMDRLPDEYPIEARTVAADDSWLSPAYGRDSVALNFSRTYGKDNRPFFEAIDEALAPVQGRPHWGKQPYLRDAEFYRSVYPRWNDFVELRRQLDPAGTFLNAGLRPLLE